MINKSNLSIPMNVFLFLLGCSPLCISAFVITLLIFSPQSVVPEIWLNQRQAAFVLVILAVLCTSAGLFLIHLLTKNDTPSPIEKFEDDEETRVRRIKMNNRMKVSHLVIIEKRK